MIRNMYWNQQTQKHAMIDFQWGLYKLFKRSNIIFSLIISFIMAMTLGFHKIPSAGSGQNPNWLITGEICLLKQKRNSDYSKYIYVMPSCS